MKKIFILPILFLGLLAACSPKSNEAKEVANTNTANSQVQIQSEANLAAANKFLEENKTKTGVVTTKSGLQYQIIEEGNKNAPKAKYDSIVRVNYEGSLLDGKVFDSSYKRGVAAEFPVNQLIPAWIEALQLMKEGDELILWAHPDIGYGSMGLPIGCGVDMACDIPANSLLKFKMRLEKVIGSAGSENSSDITSADKPTGDNAVIGEGH